MRETDDWQPTHPTRQLCKGNWQRSVSSGSREAGLPTSHGLNNSGALWDGDGDSHVCHCRPEWGRERQILREVRRTPGGTAVQNQGLQCVAASSSGEESKFLASASSSSWKGRDEVWKLWSLTEALPLHSALFHQEKQCLPRPHLVPFQDFSVRTLLTFGGRYFFTVDLSCAL